MVSHLKTGSPVYPWPTHSKPHGAQWLRGRTSVGTHNSAAGKTPIGVEALASSASHSAHHGITDRAVLNKVRLRHAKKLNFSLVGVGDDSALNVLRRTRNAREQGCDGPAGAALCRGNGLPAGLEQLAHHLFDA